MTVLNLQAHRRRRLAKLRIPKKLQRKPTPVLSFLCDGRKNRLELMAGPTLCHQPVAFAALCQSLQTELAGQVRRCPDSRLVVVGHFATPPLSQAVADRLLEQVNDQLFELPHPPLGGRVLHLASKVPTGEKMGRLMWLLHWPRVLQDRVNLVQGLEGLGLIALARCYNSSPESRHQPPWRLDTLV